MADRQFKEGEPVQHKSGGPKMIYVGVDEIGQAICEWFDNGKKSATFSHSALEPYREPPPVKTSGPLA